MSYLTTITHHSTTLRSLQLTHSYCELAQTTAKRQEHLQYTYGFNCRCERCVDTDLDGRLEETLPDPPLTVKQELITYLALYDEATMIDKNDPEEENRLGSRVCRLMRQVYGKLNLTLYKMESEQLATR